MNHKRVFVSGGAGVIGRPLCDLLLDRGVDLLVGDLKPCPDEWIGRLQYRMGDLNHLTWAEIDAFAPDLFIHLAATFERSAESWEFWDENFHHNVALSHRMMSLMRETATLKRVIFASSYLIYDPALYLSAVPSQQPTILSESALIRPRNLVGMAKLAHEMELRFMSGFEQTHFDAVSVRIFRGYGCGSRDVISRWVRALLQEEVISVYQREGMFDYIYAKDSASGLIRLAEAALLPKVVNLGTGRSRRVHDVLNVLSSHFPRMRYREEASDLPFEASEADMTLYRKRTNWLPEYELESAMREIIEHESNRLSVNGARVTRHV